MSKRNSSKYKIDRRMGEKLFDLRAIAQVEFVMAAQHELGITALTQRAYQRSTAANTRPATPLPAFAWAEISFGSGAGNILRRAST